MTQAYIVAVAAVAGLVSWVLVGQVRSALLRHRLLDHPNERSSHTQATPRGGGLAILGVLIPAWLFMSYLTPLQSETAGITRWLLPAGALLLAAVSFVDDMRGLPQWGRLLVQAVAVAAAVPFLPGPVFQGLLWPWLDTVAAAIVWLWFINLFNFMDGIDGIAGVEAIGIGVGLYAIGAAFMPIAADFGQGLAIAV